MLTFCTTRPSCNPTMPDGVIAPTLESECGRYRIDPSERRGGFTWTLRAPGTIERFAGGSPAIRLAEAIRRADTLAAIDRAIDLRGLVFEDD
jgi:hypothetical protein